MKPPIRWLICLLGLMLSLAACNRQPAAPNPVISELPTPTPPTLGALRDARRIAADFLNAWREANYAAMHALLSLNAQDAYPLPDFERLYRQVSTQMTLVEEGINYTFTGAVQDGSEAQFAYDVTFSTRAFGQFSDTDRILRLFFTAEGWRLVWTPADIFREFQEGASLRSEQARLNRGNIYDRDGEALADQNGVALEITLRTQYYPTGNPYACFTELAKVFPARTADAMQDLYGDKTGDDFAFIIGTLAQERFLEAQADLERHCTLTYEPRPIRRYLAGGLAPHVVGFVGAIPAERAAEYEALGYPRDAVVGLDGVEGQLEDVLAGTGTARLYLQKDGQIIRILAERAGVPSQSVYLTLDRKLQEATQKTLRDAFELSALGRQSPGAAAVILEVKTGKILAIASYPDFNVEAFNPNSTLPNAQDLIREWANDPRKPTFNRATLGQFAPGSVFKIVSMAAALESGEFKPNSRYYCSGTWNGTPLGDRIRKDWIASTEAGQHGSITLVQALTGSCNIWFWHIGWTLSNLNPEILPNIARIMGFGRSTGITDLADAPGQLPNPAQYEQLTGRRWRNSDALNAVIGQGDVVVTPLQIANMSAAIANGGTLYKPYVVEKIGIINEPSFIAEPQILSKLNFAPETIQAIQRGMCEVTTNQTIGTATFVFESLEGVTVCAKTGTAETPFGAGLTHAWFTGYAGRQSDQPEIAFAVLVERGGEGSGVAAPIARRLIEYYFDLPITPWWEVGN